MYFVMAKIIYPKRQIESSERQLRSWSRRNAKHFKRPIVTANDKTYSFFIKICAEIKQLLSLVFSLFDLCQRKKAKC